MTTIGLVGAGAMGSALGANWLAGGQSVLTCLTGRSPRTRDLATEAGLGTVFTLEQLVGASDLVVSVVPPGSAVAAAQSLATAARRAGVAPVVADLNAVSPPTMAKVAAVLGSAGCPVVDGSISAAPPRAGGEPATIYVSGPRARSFAALSSPWLDVVVLDAPVGAASALKMCTASMYKGVKALILAALLTAEVHGVREQFVADVAREWPEGVPHWHTDVAVAAAKAWRFVDEMREISRTQGGVGLPPELFEGVAALYSYAAATPLGRTPLEALDRSATVEEVLAGLRREPGVPAGDAGG